MAAGPHVAYERDASERVNRISSIPFAAVHLVPLAIIWVGVAWRDVVLCGVLYATRMFFITAGYHRYFAHHTYKMNRFWQFLMALGGTTAVQKGPLWWAALHRDHHRFADTPEDIHSPLKGSGGATSAGSCATSTARPAWTGSPTSPASPSCGG